MKICPQCQQEYTITQRYCNNDQTLLDLKDIYGFAGKTVESKYRIEALVGIGAFGAVYRAFHHVLDRQVAFKILRPDTALNTPAAINLFESEAKTVARLQHPNIVTVFDAGRTPEGIAYIVMEWLEGRTLREELNAKCKLGFKQTADILKQICAALEEAHNNKIVHRDLKPENVMLVKRRNGSEQVKVLDFGLAKVLSTSEGSRISLIGGTAYYASPEQWTPGSLINVRADIYALGVMVYEMLGGELPFKNATSQEELIKLKKNSSPLSLRALRSDVPPEVEGLVMRMMAKKNEHRPQNAGEIYGQFEHACKLNSPPAPSPPVPKPTKLFLLLSRSQKVLLQKLADFRANYRFSVKELFVTYLNVGLQKFHDFREKAKKAVEQLRPTRITKLNLVAVIGAIAVFIWLAFFEKNLLRVNPPIVLPSPSVSPTPTLTAVVTPQLVPPVVEVLRFSQEFKSDDAEQFRLHFTAREDGYLYLIAPDQFGKLMAALTNNPAPVLEMDSNRLFHGRDFAFPKKSWLLMTKGTKSVQFTLIFSSLRLGQAAFLSTSEPRKLTPNEQSVLIALRGNAKKVRDPYVDESQGVIGAREADTPLVVDFKAYPQRETTR